MMKTSFSLVVFALALVSVLPIAAQQEDAVGAATTVLRLEKEWADAQKAADASKVAPMLAESFVNTDFDGSVSGKANLLANLKGGKWELNEISDVKVTVFGNAAVATGAWVGKGIDGDGTKVDRRERWTDTWIRTPNGNWQCVASQQTTAKK